MSSQVETDSYLTQFSAFEKGLNGEARSYVHEIRKRAFQDFSRLGFPTAKLEDWKYTNTSALAKVSVEPKRKELDLDKAQKALEKARNGIEYKNEVVLVDGYFVAELSKLEGLAKGAVIGSLAQGFTSHPACIQLHLAEHASGQLHALAALNTAFTLDGLFVYLPKDSKVAEPLHVAVISTSDDVSAARYSRLLVVLEQGSQIKIVENHVGASPGAYLSNFVCEMVLGANARCEHVKVVDENNDAFHVSNLNVKQDQDSAYRFHGVTLGGALVRNDIRVSLSGLRAECSLFGLDVAKSSQHVDNLTLIEHAQPHCKSTEVYKGIFDDSASGSFCGKVWVAEGADKTDASQVNRNLLLSKNALVNARPQLEIYADDVKCSHGATVGQLDENALFYLRARGIHKDTAKSMLTHAFAKEILETLENEALRAVLEQRIKDWMSGEDSSGRLP